jgi:OOP family OmpA-OmpF porin
MKSKRAIIIAGIIALAALCIICLFRHLDPVKAKIQAAGLGSAGPTFILDTYPDTVVLRGKLPHEGVRNILRSLVGASFDPRTVVDSTVVVSGLVDAPWNRAALALIPSLSHLVSDPHLFFQSHTVVVRGTVHSSYQKGKLQESLHDVQPGIILVDSMTVVPTEEALVALHTIEALLERNGIEFQPGSASLTDQGRKVLDRLVPFVQEIHETTIEIGGHTDVQEDSDDAIQLSRDRAESVKAYLVQKGIDDFVLEIQGYGATVPRVDGDSPRTRQRNRRVEFSLR